jgi:hypothetical protein
MNVKYSIKNQDQRMRVLSEEKSDICQIGRYEMMPNANEFNQSGCKMFRVIPYQDAASDVKGI